MEKKIIRVEIMPKKEILDPQGGATLQALHSLGYNEVKDVRIGKNIEIVYEGKEKNQRIAEIVKQMCEKFLSNPIIEDYKIHIED